MFSVRVNLSTENIALNLITLEKRLFRNHFIFSLYYKKHLASIPNIIPPSSNFLTWFIGFTEAEGSFIVNNRGDLSFVITQSTSDIGVLHYIKETLGFGKVIAQSLKCSRYVTQNKKEIEIIISIFNGNTILPARKKKLETFIKAFNSWASKGNIKLNTILFIENTLLPSLSNSWLAGFTDGEGCFTCSIGEKKGFSFNYSLAQKGKDNKVILQEVCFLFKGGLVSSHHVKDVFKYRITGVKSCANIFGYFDKYTLLTKKSVSYVLWKDIYRELVEKHHLNPEKRLLMIEKARRINILNTL